MCYLFVIVEVVVGDAEVRVRVRRQRVVPHFLGQGEKLVVAREGATSGAESQVNGAAVSDLSRLQRRVLQRHDMTRDDMI